MVAAELLKETRKAQIVAAELLRRFEIKTDERMDHLEAIQGAMARWMEKMADQQTGHEARMAEQEARMANLDVKIAALVDAQMETEKALGDLSRTVDRYLRSRSNGGTA